MADAERKVGPYVLVKQVGRGAFGVVWLGEKRSSIATTRFALKLPRNEDIDLEAFKQEAAIWLQASGHPNVVPLIEADVYDDQVVIVSEYVTDGSLSAWLKHHGGRAPSAEAASELMSGVLAGLAHLHGRHIIHRDLKPDNILLQHETPRLADFGIARLLKSGSQSTNVSGTLAYMAPEAFDGKRNERTDIWSTGVIFYQLLAGRLPYDQPDMVSFVGAIIRQDPPPLPESVPEVLRLIVRKALERDPLERYANAKDMRRDLREAEHKLWQGAQKTQVIEPVEPRPERMPQATVPSMPPAETEKFEPLPTIVTDRLPLIKQERKSRARLWPARTAGVLVLAILVAIGIYAWVKSYSSRPTVRVDATNQAPVSQRLFVLKQTLSAGSVVHCVAFSPDGKTLASGDYQKTVKLWNAQSGALKQTLTGHTEWLTSVAFSPDGKTLASGSADHTIKLWDAQTGVLKQTLTGHADYLRSVAFSPDGTTLASASNDRTVKLWDVQTGALKQTLTGHGNYVGSVVFSPNGKTLASGSSDDSVKVWDAQTGALKLTLYGLNPGSNSVTFSPDGTLLARASSGDKKVQLWDAQTSTLKQTLTGDGSLGVLAFSPDGNTLASPSYYDEIKLWNVQKGALKQTLTGHRGPVHSIAFSPDGKTLASGGYDLSVKLWRVE